jgi:hypothetical protein
VAKAVEKRRRVARRAGAVENAACSTARILLVRCGGSFRFSRARIASDRDQLRFRGLVPRRLDLSDDALGQFVGIAVGVPVDRLCDQLDQDGAVSGVMLQA